MPRSRLSSRVATLERYSEDGVQEVRKSRQGGPTALQRSSWRDPTDTSPTAARTAREVTFWRTYCPLRKMRLLRNSSITDMQVHAADMFRKTADAAGIGFSAVRDGLPVTEIVYGPRAGPSKADLAAYTAWLDVRRAVKPFTEAQLRMLESIVLRNWSLYRWCEAETERLGKKRNADQEMGMLRGILENLVAYYKTDIEQGLANGWILAIS